MMETFFPDYTVKEAIDYLEGLGYTIDYHAGGGYVIHDPQMLSGTVTRNDIDLIRYVQGLDVGAQLTMMSEGE